MFRISICYGQPADPAAFDERYGTVRVPLARKIPGLAGFIGVGRHSPTGANRPDVR